MAGRAATPFHCPFCGEENLWPHAAETLEVPAWECRSCLRAFTVTSLGQLSRPAALGERR